MKTSIVLTLLLFCSSAVYADNFATFTVLEETQPGFIPFTNTPTTDLIWQITGPINATPATAASEYFADFPIIFQLFGITPVPFKNGGVELFAPPECVLPETCFLGSVLVIYPTDLPPGIDVSSTVNIPIQTPEPASFLLLGSGLLGIGAFARLRHRFAVGQKC